MSIPKIEDQELLSSIRGKLNRVLGGEFGTELDAASANPQTNTVSVTGPALCVIRFKRLYEF